MRTYKYIANAVVSVHVLWTLFLIGGAIAMFFYPWYAAIQIMAISFTLLIALPFSYTCPLTLFEEKLRRKIDPQYRNDGSYLAVYINKIFKTRITPARISTIVGGLYTITVAAAIAILIISNGWV